MRGLEWWLNDALEEFPSVDAREAAARALNKANRIDQLMEQVLDTALAPQGGIRLDMNDEEETPAPAQEDAPRAPTTTPSTNFKSSLLPHGTYGLKTIEIWAQTTVTAALGEGSAILDTASLHERPGTASLKVVCDVTEPWHGLRALERRLGRHSSWTFQQLVFIPITKSLLHLSVQLFLTAREALNPTV
jgi:hypothetical protein